MKKYNILVSGASGIVGYGVLRSLKHMNNCYLLGTTIYDISPACCFADEVLIAPHTESPQYIPWLKEQIRIHRIDMLIPTIEIDVEVWSKNQKELEQLGVVVLLNNLYLIEACLDKMKFSQILLEHRLSCRIESWKSIEEVPTEKRDFVIKPKKGFGSKGIHFADSVEELQQYAHMVPKTHFVQEFVGTQSEEYTVSCFFDQSSKLCALMALKRQLSKQGFTEYAEKVDSDIFKPTILELTEVFKPVGPTNFQFRTHNGQLKLLEINPRISSSTSIRTLLGYNEAGMAVDYFLDHKPVEQVSVKSGKVIRYVEDYLL